MSEQGGYRREAGGRERFVGRLRERLAGGAPANVAHPLPPLGGPVPEVRYRALDPEDLLGTFRRAAEANATVVHLVDGERVPPEVLAEVVRAEEVRRAVVSIEPEAAAVGETLAGLGVEVAPYDREAAAVADLGVTSAVAGVAVTGSVVQDSARSGGRAASLLPRVHLCVLPADRLVATPADVLRPLGADRPPAANLVLISSRSRSGDIESTLTWGVHGPTALHVALVGLGNGARLPGAAERERLSPTVATPEEEERLRRPKAPFG